MKRSSYRHSHTTEKEIERRCRASKQVWSFPRQRLSSAAAVLVHSLSDRHSNCHLKCVTSVTSVTKGTNAASSSTFEFPGGGRSYGCYNSRSHCEEPWNLSWEALTSVRTIYDRSYQNWKINPILWSGPSFDTGLNLRSSLDPVFSLSSCEDWL